MPCFLYATSWCLNHIFNLSYTDSEKDNNHLHPISFCLNYTVPGGREKGYDTISKLNCCVWNMTRCGNFRPSSSAGT